MEFKFKWKAQVIFGAVRRFAWFTESHRANGDANSGDEVENLSRDLHTPFGLDIFVQT